MDGTRVLLVDDETEFAEILAERMEARGLQVETADSGEAAVRLVEKKPFDAILLDLAMPGMDGIETLKRLRKLNPDLQIILLTGHATVDKGVEAMKLGAIDFVEKPADIDKLMAKIEVASSRKLELTEKRMEEQMADIMRKKGW